MSLYLYNHQKIAVKKFLIGSNKIIVRLPGSGKTAIGISLIRKFSENENINILWISPAHLISQVKYEFKKWNCNLQPKVIKSLNKNTKFDGVFIISYSLMRKYSDYLTKINWNLIIADEIHRGKNKKTITNCTLSKLFKKSDNVVGLTATPFQNSPYEFFNIVELISKRYLSSKLEQFLVYKYPKNKSIVRKFFNKLNISIGRLNQGPIIGIQNNAQLKSLLHKYVDWQNPLLYQEECKYPSIKEEYIKVQLSENEINEYQKILKTYRKKKDKDFLNDDLDERQISNGFNRLIELRKFLIKNQNISTKSKKLISDLLKISMENNKVLVFSNFVKYGIEILAKELKKKKIRYSIFTGKTSKKNREKILNEYLYGNTNILLLSPVGFEGLNLINTNYILILDPHFNPEKTTQIVYRAIRSNSDIKKINIKHYISTTNKSGLKTIDEVIIKIAERKRLINNLLISLLNEK